MSLSRPSFRWKRLVRVLCRRYPRNANLSMALINVVTQRMYLVRHLNLITTYRVSTSKFGTGSMQNSLCTPLGAHRVCEKIGEACEPLTLFCARELVDRKASINPLATISSEAVCARILWLEGIELGYNRGGYVDSRKRFIYIHGTVDERRIGVPSSIGCIRMRNDDVIEAFKLLDVGSLVYIIGKRSCHFPACNTQE